MKLYLLKDKQLALKYTETPLHSLHFPMFRNLNLRTPVIEIPAVETTLEPADGEVPSEAEFCKTLKHLLESSVAEVTTNDGDGGAKKKSRKAMDWSISLELKFNRDDSTLGMTIKGSVLDGLHQICGENRRATVKVTLKNFITLGDINRYSKTNGLKWLIAELADFTSTSTKEMEILFCKTGRRANCCEVDLKLPTFLKQKWLETLVNSDISLTAKFTIELRLYNFNEHCLLSPVVYQKILEDGFGTDVVIRSGDGMKFPCHRSFLAANSPLLETMLKTDMQEARTGKINMTDMTGEGVKTFLTFLYYRNHLAAVGNPSLAMELFEAGEKYDIFPLKKAMAIILSEMNEASWTAAFALKLYLFVKRIDLEGFGDKLKTKTITVIMKNGANLKESEMFQQLFTKDPETALGLVQDMCNKEIN